MPVAVGIMADSYNKPAGGGWTPIALVTLATWLSPRDAATVTASGGYVDQITDKSGLGHTYAKTGTYRPAYGSRTINGHAAMDFDGVDDNLAGTYTMAQPFTVGVVVQLDNPDAVQRVFSFTTGLRYAGTAATGSGTWYLNAATILESSATPDTNPHAVVYIVNGTTSSIRLDGVQVAAGAAGAATMANPHGVGGNTTNTNTVDGAIGDLVVASSVLAGTDLSNLETFLRGLAGT